MTTTNFHDHEIYFCGFSNSGKTTLISRLIKKMNSLYKIGYLKHDTHKFCMDHEEKDTWRVTQAGAIRVAITSNEKNSYLMSDKYKDHFLGHGLSDCDMIFVEGFKFTSCPKILVLGEAETKRRILDKFYAGDISDVMALVGTEQNNTTGIDRPYFCSDDIQGIEEFIINFFSRKFRNIPIFGLILAGGKSNRMGEDKGMIDYHGMPQVDHAQKILKNFTKECFISCRKEQANRPHLKGHSLIYDRLIDMGPSGGIVSAFMEHKKVAWLVVACDLPFLDEETVRHLIEKRNPFKVATCYRSKNDHLPEPLCAIYEPCAQKKFFQFFAQGYKCPRKMLINSNVLNIDLLNENSLANANTPLDFKQAKEKIGLGAVIK